MKRQTKSKTALIYIQKCQECERTHTLREKSTTTHTHTRTHTHTHARTHTSTHAHTQRASRCKETISIQVWSLSIFDSVLFFRCRVSISACLQPSLTPAISLVHTYSNKQHGTGCNFVYTCCSSSYNYCFFYLQDHCDAHRS